MAAAPPPAAARRDPLEAPRLEVPEDETITRAHLAHFRDEIGEYHNRICFTAEFMGIPEDEIIALPDITVAGALARPEALWRRATELTEVVGRLQGLLGPYRRIDRGRRPRTPGGQPHPEGQAEG
jgi:hypothetical protein